MSVRALLAVIVALGATGAAASVPLFLDGPMVSMDLPDLGAASAGHAGHGGPAASAHAGHAAHASGSAAEPTHVHGATSADEAAAHDPAGHAGHGADAVEDGPHAEWSHSGHGDGTDQPGMQRPHFPPASGKIPSSPNGLKQMPTTRVLDDGDLDALATKGSGTLSDPYILRGLYFPGELELRDTDACVVVRENWFAGQLALNWNGQCVWVHDNHIADLRVNENIARTGFVTGGLIERNAIGIVGQLRHYDGEFRDNVVGPAPPDALFDPVQETTPLLFGVQLVANVDGFNQGSIHHNTFHGTVDLDFHGHHHGTGFFAPHSHYHGDSSQRQADHLHDHSDRWTSVVFADNTIIDPKGYGLRYEDENHAGDDRRANSEEMEVLNEPHVHHTDITLVRNLVQGGQVWVDVFNADDSLHHERNPGRLTIADNRVETRERDGMVDGEACLVRFSPFYNEWTGIHVQFAKEVAVRITGNTLSFAARQPASDPASTALGLVRTVQEACNLWSEDERTPAAVRLGDVSDADILVQGNTATGFRVGVLAAAMDEDTVWRVLGNDFGSATPTQYDDTVANRPRSG